jgi:hypothetical protein
MKIISYYLNSGDQENSEMFSPYLWKEYGFDRVLENYLTDDYGHDLTLLLIAYYLEGKFSSYLPLEPVLGNYIRKIKI